MDLSYRELEELTEEIINYYWAGELDRVIKRHDKKLKLSENRPDSDYCTIRSIDFDKPYTANISTHSDPTGSRAVRLADISREREKSLNFYSKCKDAIDCFAKSRGLTEANITDRDLRILKIKIKRIIREVLGCQEKPKEPEPELRYF